MLQRVIKRIGGNDLTLSAYLDNIVREHLAEYKAEINRMGCDNSDVL